MSGFSDYRTVLQPDLVVLVRLFCLLCISAIVVARLIPASRKRFLSYGARVQPVSLANKQKQAGHQRDSFQLLDKLASIDVPHSWFTHFYILSLALALFWLIQIVSQSSFLHLTSVFVLPRQYKASSQGSLLCVMLMIVQSMRRLWESIQFASGSNSRMWIGHYAFGLAFYFVTNIAVWIEGVHAILESNPNDGHWTAWSSSAPHVFGLTLYTISAVMQYLAHAHLAQLPKYSVPRHWLFGAVIAPHYTAECATYFGLAMITAPEWCLFNRSLLCVALLTTVNLGITAYDTKVWMVTKFREDEIELKRKYCMLPGIW